MAETNILPGANGSARIGFADGTEAIVGVKAEVEKTLVLDTLDREILGEYAYYAGEDEIEGLGTENTTSKNLHGQMRWGGQSSWIEMSIEIPGLRDDDALPVFLAEMMREALAGSGSESDAVTEGRAKGLKGRLVINQGWHWRIYIDVGSPSRCFGLTDQLIFLLSDSSSLATAFISSSLAVSNDSPCTPLHKTPQTQIQRRGRPNV